VKGDHRDRSSSYRSLVPVVWRGGGGGELEEPVAFPTDQLLGEKAPAKSAPQQSNFGVCLDAVYHAGLLGAPKSDAMTMTRSALVEYTGVEVRITPDLAPVWVDKGGTV
jgi:hypothetical protein